MNNPLAHKIVLITGGTSRLGSALVLKALHLGARVLLTYHQHDAEAKALEKKGAECFKLDLSDMRAIEEFSKSLKEKIEGLDILIHNAAAIRDHTIQNMSEEEWDYVLNVDLKAPYYLTKKLLSFLFRRQMSKVFMITSRVAASGGYGVSNYAAAKGGLAGLVKSLAQELAKKNVLVNAVNPGFMKSRMTESLPEAIFERNLNLNPLGRFSDPEEVADFILYLATDAMTQVTGQIFNFESRKNQNTNL